MSGPIFHRELKVHPRKGWSYCQRAVYPAVFLVLMSTAWAIMTGTQRVQTLEDFARFGGVIFRLMAPLLLIFLHFAGGVLGASIVAQEKDRKTLVLLLMTRLTNAELILGKLGAGLVPLLVAWIAVAPIFVSTILLGGVAPAQVARTLLVVAMATVLAGCLGVVVAFWREKTFQSIGLTILVLGAWLGFWESVHLGLWGPTWSGISTEVWAAGFSPLRAVLSAARPFPLKDPQLLPWFAGERWFLVGSVVISAFLALIGIVRVRTWNTLDEVRGRRRGMGSSTAEESPVPHSESLLDATEISRARRGHVDARDRAVSTARSREVWDNPILWREVRTWAHGRKMLLVRAAFLALALVAIAGLSKGPAGTAPIDTAAEGTIAEPARIVVPLVLVSFLLVNAIAVISVTMERDGRALDLLLATDLTPREFLIGKLGGVASVGGLMLLTPIVLAVFCWFRGWLSLENLGYALLSLIALGLFVMVLGIHCGMRYANSRGAIAASLGTIFFVSLGVVTCVLIMVSFSGSFQLQLAPFLAFILGGALGLFVVLSAGNPSSALAMASAGIPLATFYVITSVQLRQYLPACLVTLGSYGFATAAMLVPKLTELDFAFGRDSATDE